MERRHRPRLTQGVSWDRDFLRGMALALCLLGFGLAGLGWLLWTVIAGLLP